MPTNYTNYDFSGVTTQETIFYWMNEIEGLDASYEADNTENAETIREIEKKIDAIKPDDPLHDYFDLRDQLMTCKDYVEQGLNDDQVQEYCDLKTLLKHMPCAGMQLLGEASVPIEERCNYNTVTFRGETLYSLPCTI